jgi:hypothetical protein
MKQILHIFYKDVRRFRGEIAISLALLAVFTWMGPRLWRDAGLGAVSYSPLGYFGLGHVDTLLMLLIPISWWLLIARVVHEERLVGDRQFWITRPYEWQNLLAAKALLVVCFVYLPLAAAQWWLLQMAGLHPANHIGALLYEWLLITAIFVLPLAALAAVTRNFARMTLTLLGVFVAVGIVAATLSALLQNGGMHSPVEHDNPIGLPLLLVFCAAAVLIAYSRRKISLGRILLLALPVLLLLSQTFFSGDAMVNHAYPLSSAGVRLTLQDNPMSFEAAHLALSRKELFVQIPLSAKGIAPGDLWMGKGVRVSIEAGGRTLWASSWQPWKFYLPSNGNTTLAFFVDRAVFDRVQPAPVTLHLEIALDQARRAQFEASQISLRDVVIPGLGVCSSIVDPERSEIINGKPTPAIAGVTCRSALRYPQLTYVETASTHGPCEAAAGTGPSPLEVRGSWIGNLNTEPAELDIAPVRVVPLPFSANWIHHNPDQAVELNNLCPGAPITFTRYGLVRQLRTELTLENFQFPVYDKREDEAR